MAEVTPAFAQFAHRLARQAGQVMLQYFYGDQEMVRKADDTPVTIADKEINAMVIEEVKRHFPGHSVLGEEASYMVEGSEWLWVCDPIDGTNAYMLGIPTAMFSLALVRDGEPVMGVAYDPFLGQLYHAVKGQGAFCGRERVHVSSQGFDGCQLAGGGTGKSWADTEPARQVLREHQARVIRFSGTVYKAVLVARGKLEGFYYKYGNAHDIAAVKVIVEEAGGKVTDRHGNEQRYDGAIAGAIVTNGAIHGQLCELIMQIVKTTGKP